LGGGPDPLATPLPKTSKKRSLTEKIRPVMPVLPSYAGTEKNLIITSFLVKFCFF